MRMDQEEFIPAQDIFKHVIRCMHFCSTYIPQTDKKHIKILYWIYIIFCNGLILLWPVRFLLCLILIRDDDAVFIMTTIGFTLFYSGFAYQVIAFSFGINKHFPSLLAIMDRYRQCFGDFREILRIRRCLKCLIVCYISFVVVSVVSALFRFKQDIFRNGDNGSYLLFYPFDVNNPTTQMMLLVYLFLLLCLLYNIMYTTFVLFVSISYIIITEMKHIETEIKDITVTRPVLLCGSEQDNMDEYKRTEKSSKKELSLSVISQKNRVQPLNNDRQNLSNFNNEWDDRAEAVVLGNKLQDCNKTDAVHMPLDVDLCEYEPEQVTETDVVPNRSRNKILKFQSGDGLEESRLKYEALLDLLSTANSCLTHYFCSSFVTALPVTCIVLYGQIRNTHVDTFLGYLTSISIISVAQMCLILFLGAYVSSKIKKPLEHVMKIDTRNYSRGLMSTVGLFTVRVVSPPVGFTVYELFAIDSATILTIFGTFVTYIIVMVQFAQAPGGGSTSCSNGTTTF